MFLDFASSSKCNRNKLMMPKFYAINGHCGSKAMSEFRAMEERFDSLDDCCRAKFPHDISNCCKDGGDDCSLSGNLKFIPVRASFLKLSGTSSFCVAHKRFFLSPFETELARSSMLRQG